MFRSSLTACKALFFNLVHSTQYLCSTSTTHKVDWLPQVQFNDYRKWYCFSDLLIRGTVPKQGISISLTLFLRRDFCLEEDSVQPNDTHILTKDLLPPTPEYLDFRAKFFARSHLLGEQKDAWNFTIQRALYNALMIKEKWKASNPVGARENVFHELLSNWATQDGLTSLGCFKRLLSIFYLMQGPLNIFILENRVQCERFFIGCQ